MKTGAVRITSESDNAFLTAGDVRIEVLQTDGTWVPITNVINLSIRIDPNEPVEAQMTMEINMLRLDGIDPKGIGAQWRRWPTRWQLAKEKLFFWRYR